MRIELMKSLLPKREHSKRNKERLKRQKKQKRQRLLEARQQNDLKINDNLSIYQSQQNYSQKQITLDLLQLVKGALSYNKYKAKMSKVQSIKIKEFEWYEVETKVREIMGQLLQPFNKKQTQESIKMNELKRTITNINKKMEDHDFLLERENSIKPTYIELQDQKIQEMSSRLTQNQINNDTKLKKMQVIIQVYEEKIKQLNELERRLDSQIQQRAADFKKYKDHLDELVALMLKKQDTQEDQINNFRSTIRGSISKLQSKMISFDNRLKQLEDDSRRKTVEINKMVEESMSHNEKIIKLDLKTISLTTKVQDRQKDSKLSEKFFGKVKEVENDLMFLHGFLEAYQPLYIQMQISETLNSFIDGKHRRKLCIFQEKKFAKLHQHILMNQKTTLEEMMAQYTNNIRKITNRNKKYVINLTVQESVKYGANIYEFRAEDVNDHDEDENKKTINVIIPEADIKRVVQDKWAQLMPELRQILVQEVEPTKNWMKQLQEQSLLRSLDFDKKFEELKKFELKNQSQTELIEKHFSEELKNINQRTRQVEKNVTYCRDHVKDILNFSSVINHIVIQDQIDRQGTALYALKSNKGHLENAPAPTIQLDPNCINCQNKNSAIINQAFKMACLSYNPSQIRIDQQFFSREEILQISTNILQKLKRKMQILGDSEIITQNSLQKIDQPRKLIDNKRKSHSVIKQSGNSLTMRTELKNTNTNFNKAKELQTLLPVLSSSRNQKQPRRERSTHFSVFY